MNIWKCPECDTNNDSVKTRCIKCSCFKSKSSICKNKYNDWVCIKCSESNFQNRTECRKCSRHKPLEKLSSSYVTIDNDAKIITISSKLDYKDYNTFLQSIGSSDEIANYIRDEIDGYNLVIDNFMICYDNDFKLAENMKQTIPNTLFSRCNIVKLNQNGKHPNFVKRYDPEQV